jgi:hypothetical protein
VLLVGTFLICLPSFFVFHCIAGLRRDFGRALGALMTAQFGVTVALCALAPLTVLFYLSMADYHAAVLFNALAFGIASLGNHASLRRAYQPLLESNEKHRLLLRVWLVLYVFVGTQLGWVLRPFVGQPGAAVQLWRDDVWGNVYVEIFHHGLSLFR